MGGEWGGRWGMLSEWQRSGGRSGEGLALRKTLAAVCIAVMEERIEDMAGMQGTGRMESGYGETWGFVSYFEIIFFFFLKIRREKKDLLGCANHFNLF